MGNIFYVGWQSFHAYAVEKHFYCWGAMALGQSPASRRTGCNLLVSDFRHQPQNCLQVVAPFHRGWQAGLERSFPSAASGAFANAPEMDPADCTGTQATPALGAEENSDLFGAPVWTGTGDGDHCPVAAAVATGPSALPPDTESLLAQVAAHNDLRWRARTQPPRVDYPDFKGWFCAGNGQRIEPLTIRDLFSRYVLVIRLLPDQRWRPTKAVFMQLFKRYGLPEVIRTDNGGPFASAGPAGLSRLSAWWTALGIRVEFIRPGHPEENGAHEQMHRLLKTETIRPAACPPSRPTTSYDRLGQELQPDSSAPSAGTRGAGKQVSKKPPALARAQADIDLSRSMASATSPQQWPDQMAQPETICRRSIYLVSDRPQAHQKNYTCRLFWSDPDRALVRPRPRSNASSRISTPLGSSKKTKDVTYVPDFKVYPCPDIMPTPPSCISISV